MVRKISDYYCSLFLAHSRKSLTKGLSNIRPMNLIFAKCTTGLQLIFHSYLTNDCVKLWHIESFKTKNLTWNAQHFRNYFTILDLTQNHRLSVYILGTKLSFTCLVLQYTAFQQSFIRNSVFLLVLKLAFRQFKAKSSFKEIRANYDYY